MPSNSVPLSSTPFGLQDNPSPCTRTPAWSPGGRTLADITETHTATVYHLLPPAEWTAGDSGRVVQRREEVEPSRTTAPSPCGTMVARYGLEGDWLQLRDAASGALVARPQVMGGFGGRVPPMPEHGPAPIPPVSAVHSRTSTVRALAAWWSCRPPLRCPSTAPAARVSGGYAPEAAARRARRRELAGWGYGTAKRGGRKKGGQRR